MSINKWQIYCNTESKWVCGWLHSDDPIPTYCFHNDSHQVNPNSAQTLETSQLITVVIQQEAIKTGGHFGCQGFLMEIPANTTQILPVTWPIPVTTSIVNIQETEANEGDVLEAIVNPRTIIGGTTSVTLQGSKNCTVNSTVIKNAQIGYECYIGTECLGRIIGINTNSFLITFENASTVEHQMGSPFYIELKIIRNYQLGTKVGDSLGAGNIGGKYLPVGTVTNVIYTNNSNTVKKFRFSVEYLF